MCAHRRLRPVFDESARIGISTSRRKEGGKEDHESSPSPSTRTAKKGKEEEAHLAKGWEEKRGARGSCARRWLCHWMPFRAQSAQGRWMRVNACATCTNIRVAGTRDGYTNKATLTSPRSTQLHPAAKPMRHDSDRVLRNPDYLLRSALIEPFSARLFPGGHIWSTLVTAVSEISGAKTKIGNSDLYVLIFDIYSDDLATKREEYRLSSH